MTRSFSLPESGYKAPRQHTTVTIRRPMIPKVDALVGNPPIFRGIQK